MVEKIYRGTNEKLSNIYIAKGATAPSIQYQCNDRDGSAIDFSEANIEFKIQLFDLDTDNETDKVASGVSSGDSNGNLIYLWAEEDTDNEGVFLCRFRVEYSDGTIEYFPQYRKQMVVI